MSPWTLISSWQSLIHKEVFVNCFFEMFSKVCTELPQKSAILDGSRSLSYSETLKLAKNIFHNLSGHLNFEYGVVVVFLPRSADLILSFLAISFTNQQYVPLSPGLPRERIRSILAALNPQQIISDEESSLILKELGFSQILSIHSLLITPPQESAVDRRKGSTPLYTLFTSGSTGSPKGITVSSDNYLNFIQGMESALGLRQQDVFLARTFTGFDISFLELYLPLFIGATVVVCPEEVANDPEAVADVISRYHVSVVQATPSFWTVAKETFRDRGIKIPILLVGGESLPVGLAQDLVKLGYLAFNMYGPTETTIWSSFYKLEKGLSRVSLGWPIVNTYFKLLDERGDYLEAGRGELLIGGSGVSLGYLNREDLTREKFIQIQGTPYYKSGDLVTIHGPGDIEYHGRIDNQVKIRGYRVELGEIESLIETFRPELRAVVKIHDPEEGSLCAILCLHHKHASAGSSWSEVWNDVYGQEAATGELDTTGWINSFTQKLYPEAEIRDWRDHTVNRITTVKKLTSTSRVLELGVGTGMILSELLPKVGHYTGVDSSPNVIRKLEIRYPDKSRLKLVVSDILSFLKSSEDHYDLVIMNSVSQYFDHLAEFKLILRQILSKLGPNGVFFLGDVRNYDCLREFQACRYLLSDSPEKSFENFMKNFREPELLISPSYFVDFCTKAKGVSISIQGREDSCFTEMSAFRFDVVFGKDEVDLPASHLVSKEQDAFLDELVRGSEAGQRVSYQAMGQRWKETREGEAARVPIAKSERFSNDPYRSSHGSKALYQDIHRFLESSLPSYMLPKLYKITDSFPYTNSGKLDRNGVSTEGAESLEATRSIIPPADELEATVLNIVKNILKATSVGMTDNLWGLGLTSLTVAKMARSIKEVQQVSLRMIEFYKLETTRDIVECIRGRKKEELMAVVPEALTLNLGPLQTLMAQASQIPLLNKALNVCFRLRLSGPCEKSSLKDFLANYFNSKIIFSGRVSEDFKSVLCSFSDADFISIQNITPELSEEFFSSAFNIFTQRPVQIVIGAQEALILLKFHHYSIDGESIALIIDDLRSHLNGVDARPSGVLDDAQFRYNHHIQLHETDEDDQYWKNLFKDLETAPFELGIPRPRQLTYRGQEILQSLPNSLTAKVQSFAVKSKVTPYSVYLYGLFLCLKKHSQARDLAVAIPVTARHNSSFEETLGCLINFLPLRYRSEAFSSHEEALMSLQEKTYEYMDRPGKTLSDILKITGHPQEATSVIAAAFAYDEDIFNSNEGGLQVEGEEIFNGFTQFNLAFRLSWVKGKLNLRAQFDTGYFDQESVLKFTTRYIEIVEGLVAGHSASELLSLSSRERDEIQAFIMGPVTEPLAPSFEERLELARGQSIHFEGRKIALDEILSHLSKHLLSISVGSKIGICMSESSSALLSQMACWILGYPIVMMSPEWGDKRLAHIISESGVAAVITDAGVGPGRRSFQYSQSEDNPLLYVLFTSGTTGVPKGVMVRKDSFENFLIAFYSKTSEFSVNKKRLLSTFASTFDAFQLTVALFLDGAEVFFLPKSDLLNFEKVFSYIREHSLEIVEFPTSVVEMLLDQYPDELNTSGIKVIYFGGEALTQKTFQLMKKCKGIKFYNLYGPAENTVISTISCVTNSPYSFPTIGGPLPNQRVLILDQNQMPCMIFQEGELYVSGHSLAEGYLDPELTAQRFFMLEGQRVYRTGDFGMWLPDGDIYFTGRKDNQVQLRGHRIELDEIDFQISEVTGPGLVRTILAGEGEKSRLVSFINSERTVDKKAILAQLRSSLPSYMIPSEIVTDVEIGLNTNGKIDYRSLLMALAERDSRLVAMDHDLVGNPVYELLASMIKEVLDIPSDPEPEKDLFSLGGNSLVVIRLRRRLLDELSLDLPVRSLFTFTIRELVEHIENEIMHEGE